MAFNGSGVYSLPLSPVVTGTTIASTWANTTLNDIATALSACFVRDGQAAMTGNINMGSQYLVALGLGSAAAPAIRWGSNNGLFSTGAGNVSISVGGVSVLEVTSGDASLNGLKIGYRQIPRLATSGGTASAEVLGKCYASTGTIEVPANVFAAGDAFSVYNNSAFGITISQGSGLTLQLAGAGSTGNRTLAARGMCTIWFNSTTEAVILGGGVS